MAEVSGGRRRVDDMGRRVALAGWGVKVGSVVRTHRPSNLTAALDRKACKPPDASDTRAKRLHAASIGKNDAQEFPG
jgi:hypothetical protein